MVGLLLRDPGADFRLLVPPVLFVVVWGGRVVWQGVALTGLTPVVRVVKREREGCWEDTVYRNCVCGCACTATRQACCGSPLLQARVSPKY